MRIDALSKVSQVYQASKPKKTSGSVAGSNRDSLELSRAGSDFLVAETAVQAAPDVRQDKVDAIRQQLASGTYSVSGRDIAEHLVERYFDLKA